MSVAASKVAEVLALPKKDRAFLAHKLISSLDQTVDADAESKWNEVIDRRSEEIAKGTASCRPINKMLKDIRSRLHASRQPS